MPETLTQTQSTQINRPHLRAAIEKEILKKCPFLLGKHVLGMDRYCDNHKVWDKFIRASFDFKCLTPHKVLVLQPRETFKSSFFVVNTVINLLISNPDVSIFIVSATDSTSTALLRQIKQHLENNEKLIKLYGTFVTDNWTQNEITIRQRKCLNKKEPSIKSLGKGSFQTGFHPDVIIFDDVVGPKDRVSASERQATLYYFQDCMDMLKKDTGQLLICGTRYSKYDLYQHIMTINKTLPEDSKFKVLITPAIDKQTKALNFPTILTQAKLDELRLIKVGKDALDFSSFSAQYLLEPLSPTDSVFHTFHYYDPQTTEFEVAIMFCDPAVSRTGCYSAAVVIGKISTGELKNKWGVIVTSIEKRIPTKLVNDVINLHKFVTQTYNVECPVYFETNGFQVLMKDNIMNVAQEQGYQLPVTGKTTTKNKEAKITGLEPYISTGFLLFRKDWATAGGGYQILMEELQSFPQGDEVDGVDALAMAHEVSRGRYFSYEPEPEPKETDVQVAVS